ncbi:MAG: hypothetical protein KF749_01795 [Bacteroidetes bacterium]|nr:hypothetical protein [Bacteroidota bacterium]MCW5896245.1 hypothetical protein [Bacteroidota bacterium]
MRSIKHRRGLLDTTTFREAMWLVGINEFLESPLIGNFFSKEAGFYLEGEVEGLPLHNDILELFVKGGIVGGGLFLSGFIAAILAGLRAHRGWSSIKRSSLEGLNVVLILTVCSALITMSFNPIINQARSGFLVFTFVGLLILIKRLMSRQTSPSDIQTYQESITCVPSLLLYITCMIFEIFSSCVTVRL